MLKEQIFDAGPVRINYAVGPDNGPPLIFLHGVTLRWQNFMPVIPELTKAYRVYSFDLRGHGLSGHVPNGYRLMDYAQDLLSFLRSQLIEPAVVFGHSLGALVAIAVTAQARARVRALVLEDPPLHYRNRPLKVTRYYNAFKEVTAKVVAAQTDIDSADLTENLWRLDPQVLTMLLEHQHMEGYDTGAFLQQIVCPTLLVQGDPNLGAVLEEEDLSYAVSLLQRCTVVRVMEGHMIHVAQPEKIIHLVKDFIGTLE